MTKRIEDPSSIHNILWVARAMAVSQEWHLTERAAPSLAALADDNDEPRLREAAEQAAKAGEHFNSASDALRGAIKLIDAGA